MDDTMDACSWNHFSYANWSINGIDIRGSSLVHNKATAVWESQEMRVWVTDFVHAEWYLPAVMAQTRIIATCLPSCTCSARRHCKYFHREGSD